MNREEIDKLWNKAIREAIDEGCLYTRYHFAELVAAAEREACAKVCDDFERAKWESVKNITQNGGRLAFAGPMHCAAAIRARGQA